MRAERQRSEQKQCMCYIQLALDQKLSGVQGITVELSRDKQCTCAHVHKTNDRTRNNLNIKPARCLSYKAFKVVLETKNITVQKIMQQYNNT